MFFVFIWRLEGKNGLQLQKSEGYQTEDLLLKEVQILKSDKTYQVNRPFHRDSVCYHSSLCETKVNGKPWIEESMDQVYYFGIKESSDYQGTILIV